MPKGLRESLVPPRQSDVYSLLSWNESIYEKVRNRFRQLVHGGKFTDSDPLLQTGAPRPLFRALLLYGLSREFSWKYATATISQFPVYLIRTGDMNEVGLSRPISFDFIKGKREQPYPMDDRIVKTSLESAIEFVMALEARECPRPYINPANAVNSDIEEVGSTPYLDLNIDGIARRPISAGNQQHDTLLARLRRGSREEEDWERTSIEAFPSYY